MKNKSPIKIKRVIKKIIYVLALFLFLFGKADIAESASLSLRSSGTSVSVGNIISVRATVNTDGKYVNNAEGVIQFPTDLLEVLSVSKSSSIFSLWVEEPRFSNYDGSISFNGGVPNPGYSGNGEVITVTFKAKKAGSASVIFSDASVRENDGLGTDILTSKSAASIQIQDSAKTETNTKDTQNNAVKETTANTANTSAPAKPAVISSTHPKQDVWYKGTSALFSWSVPNSVTSVQASLNKSELNAPSVTYDGSVSRKTLNDLDDGVYYLNLRLKNNNGWSETAHYKINVDNTAPETLELEIIDADNAKYVQINSQDKASGIEHYELSVDSGTTVKFTDKDLVDKKYKLPLYAKGNHNLSVIAYDKAGNKKESTITFPVSDIVPPEITTDTESVEVGDNVTISGKTIYPNAKVEILVNNAGNIERYEQVTDKDGKFELVLSDIKQRGRLEINANLVLGNNQTVGAEKSLSVNVGDPKSLENIKKIVYPTVEIIIALFVGLMLLIGLYIGWHRFFGIRKQYREDLKVMGENVHKTMLLLKKELKAQLKVLQKIKEDRELNEKEEIIFEEIQNNIDDVEKFIQKKIKKLM